MRSDNERHRNDSGMVESVGVAADDKELLDALGKHEEQDMYNCHDDILAYHNEKVTLS